MSYSEIDSKNDSIIDLEIEPNNSLNNQLNNQLNNWLNNWLNSRLNHQLKCQRQARRTSRRFANPGFTLVEMIVATVLLTVGVVGALGAIHSAAQSTIQADGSQTAAILAQKQITELQLQPDQLTGGDQQGDFGDDYPGYHWQQSLEATDYTNLFKVTVTITWGQTNDQRKRDFVTYLTTGQKLQQQNVSTTSSNTGSGGQ